MNELLAPKARRRIASIHARDDELFVRPLSLSVRQRWVATGSCTHLLAGASDLAIGEAIRAALADSGSGVDDASSGPEARPGAVAHVAVDPEQLSVQGFVPFEGGLEIVQAATVLPLDATSEVIGATVRTALASALLARKRRR